MWIGCGVDYSAEDIDMIFCFGNEIFGTSFRATINMTLVES